MKDYINNGYKVYMYCLQWPAVMENYKVNVESIESEINSIRKTFDFLSDKDGSQRKKEDSLQIEAKLEHFLGLLKDAKEYEQNPSIPDILSHAIDLLVETKSLSVSIKLVVPELKKKYKWIFQKKSS